MSVSLLQYDYADNFSLVANATTVTASAVFASYLVTIGVPFVESLPTSNGVYCISESGINNVYQVIIDENDTPLNYLQYSLKWLSVPA